MSACVQLACRTCSGRSTLHMYHCMCATQSTSGHNSFGCPLKLICCPRHIVFGVTSIPYPPNITGYIKEYMLSTQAVCFTCKGICQLLQPPLLQFLRHYVRHFFHTMKVLASSRSQSRAHQWTCCQANTWPELGKVFLTNPNITIMARKEFCIKVAKLTNIFNQSLAALYLRHNPTTFCPTCSANLF